MNLWKVINTAMAMALSASMFSILLAQQDMVVKGNKFGYVEISDSDKIEYANFLELLSKADSLNNEIMQISDTSGLDVIKMQRYALWLSSVLDGQIAQLANNLKDHDLLAKQYNYSGNDLMDAPTRLGGKYLRESVARYIIEHELLGACDYFNHDAIPQLDELDEAPGSDELRFLKQLSALLSPYRAELERLYFRDITDCYRKNIEIVLSAM